MRPSEASLEAERWTGYARSIARRYGVPATYSAEDWEAEALLGLAKALRGLDRTRPGSASRYVESVVENHLKRCIRAVLTAPKAPVGLQMYRRDETWGQGPPRVTFARSKSMDATLTADGESMVRHEVVPNPMAQDPYEAAVGADLLARVAQAARAMPEAQRRTVGFLLRGMTMTEEAEATGDTTGAVRTRRTRVRQKLALALEAA